MRCLPERSLSALGAHSLGTALAAATFLCQKDLMASCTIMDQDQTLSAAQMLLCCCFLKINIFFLTTGQQSCKDHPSGDTPMLLVHWWQIKGSGFLYIHNFNFQNPHDGFTITESLRLEKTFKITESSLWPIPMLSTRPRHIQVLKRSGAQMRTSHSNKNYPKKKGKGEENRPVKSRSSWGGQGANLTAWSFVITRRKTSR